MANGSKTETSPVKGHRLLPILAVLLLCTPGGTASLTAQQSTGVPVISGFIQAGASTDLVAESYGWLPTMPAAGAGTSFHLRQARLYLQGSFDSGPGYVIKTNLVGGFALLNAYVRWQSPAGFELRAGKVLKPFSRERLHPAHRLLTLNRSLSSLRTVKALGYGDYDTGVMVIATPGPVLQAGLFNGSAEAARERGDADSGKNLVARIALPLGDILSVTGLEIAGNVSLLHLGPPLPSAGRENLAWGLDAAGRVAGARIEVEMLCAENWSLFDASSGRSPRTWTAIVTGALPLLRRAGTVPGELALRIERFDPSDAIEQDEMYLVTPNLNLTLTPTSRLQAGLQYEIPNAPDTENALSLALLWQVDFFPQP